MKPIVAIIGRPNVGKSTLFNTLARRNIAIIDDVPGVTRDRNYTDISREGCSFTLVDTGGFDPGTGDDLGCRIQDHARVAVEEADVIIFLMDALQGLMPGDIDIARVLHKSKKPVLFVVNKAEGGTGQNAIPDFYRLGVEDLIDISAKYRNGIGDLQAALSNVLPESEVAESRADETVVSIIGRPNVGKSSFVNRLVGFERTMVSDTAGTTRDPVDTVIRYKGQALRFIDTAGIRKKNKISYKLEKYCIVQALRSISGSSISILMLDAGQGVTTQDEKLAARIRERNRACIIVVNKWDTIKKESGTHDEFVRTIRNELAFVDYAPIVTVSALTGMRVRNILDILHRIGPLYRKRVQTAELNDAIAEIVRKNPPPRGPSRATKLYYGAQVSAGPPVFKLYANNPASIPQHYERYIERALRERFGFEGVPLCLQFSRRSKSEQKGVKQRVP